MVAGHLGSRPEMRYTASGTAVTNFSVATNRRWTSDDGTPQEETVWWRVTAWGRQAEVCNEYLDKGSAVLVVGRVGGDQVPSGEAGKFQIVPHKWEGRDGQVRTRFEITARTVRFLGGGASPAPERAGAEPDYEEPEEEEIPF